MAEIIVTSTADSGAGSLRQAIINARDGDVILFDTTVFPSGTTTAILLSTNLAINKEIVIDAGANETPRVALDAQNNSRCLYLQPGASGTLRGLLFCNASNSTNGGAVYCSATDSITFTQCKFNNNLGNTGGATSTTVAAILTFGTCEFTGNTASSHGGAVYCSSGATLTFDDCTFSGNTTNSSGGGFFATGTCQSTFNNCFFSGNSAGTSGGGVSLTGTSQSTLNDCAIRDCNASDGGGVFSSNSSQTTLNGCVISGCNSSTYGGGFSGGSASQNILNDCTISGCRATSNGGGLYVRGTSQNTLNNCTIVGNTSKQDATKRDAIIGETSVAIISESKFGALRINQTAQVTVLSGMTSVDTLTLLDSGDVHVTLTIADGAALTVTTSATIPSGASFTSAGRAYLATAVGLDFSAATLTNVVLCNYGAGLRSFRINAAGAAWTADDDSIPILLEQRNGDAWTTIDASATGGSYATAFGLGATARAFDGETFLTATVVFHAWLEYEQTITVATATAKVYDVAAQSTNRYRITKGFIMASQYYNRGEAPVFFARIEDSETSTIVPQSAVSAISYTAYKVTTSWSTEKRTPVEGHEDVDVPLAAYLDALVTDDPRWTEDETGYNFIFEPDTTENPIFPDGGKYVVVVTIQFEGANPAPITYEVAVN